MRYLSVCSGIEAASVAWHHLGWQPVGFSEIEPFPSAVLAHRFPNVPNFGDMTRHAEWNLGPGSVDLLVGGTPCQSFSVAGLRKGLSDPRGGLMLTYLEIAQRLRPRWIVWENVPGVLSSGGGRDFGSFLGALGELGYGWAYRVLDAQWVRTQRHPRAVPQRRRRVFVVGCLGDPTAAAQVLFERESVCRDSAPRRASREGAAADAEGCAGTVSSKWAKGTGGPAGDECYKLTTGYRWQNNRDGLVEDGTAPACRASTGSSGFHEMNHPVIAQPVPIQDGREMQKAQNGIGIGQQGDPAYTLDTTGAQAVAHPVAFQQNTRDEVRMINGDGRIAGALAAESGMKQQNYIAHPVAFRKYRRAQSVNDHETWVAAEQANTLNQFDTGERDTHAVAHGFYSTGGTHGLNHHPEVSPAVKVGSGLGIPSPPAVAFQACGDRDNPSISVSDTAFCLPANAMSDRGQAVAFDWQKGNDVNNPRPSTMNVAVEHSQTIGTTRTPAVAVESLQQQGYDDGHASTQEADAVATLRVLRDEIGAEAFTAWGLGVLDSLQPSQVLRSRLHGEGIRCASFSRSWPIDCAISRPEDRAAWAVQSVREAEGEGCSPSRRELPQQLAEQLGAYLSQLPCPGPQAEKLMHHLWCAGEGIGILRQALSTIQEVRRSLDVPRTTPANTMTVRRLTATECEFLQGFPRNWTLIPWRKKPAEQCPDGPRYKALGNSMACNCMAWIGERIAAYEAHNGSA